MVNKELLESLDIGLTKDQKDKLINYIETIEGKDENIFDDNIDIGLDEDLYKTYKFNFSGKYKESSIQISSDSMEDVLYLLKKFR